MKSDFDVVLLAGGKGKRLGYLTEQMPKALVEIGGIPMIEHVIAQFTSFGLSRFIIAAGYLGGQLKEYFESSYQVIKSDECRSVFRSIRDNVYVELIDTGDIASKESRLLRLAPYIKRDFFLGWVDGLAKINFQDVMKQHEELNSFLTMVICHPPSRFGAVQVDSKGSITRLEEKKVYRKIWINSGYCCCNIGVLRLLSSNKDWEDGVLSQLIQDNKLMSYKYEGFWGTLNSHEDRIFLEEFWSRAKRWDE